MREDLLLEKQILFLFLKFCGQHLITSRIVEYFPSSKPRITSDLEDMLDNKKVFQKGDGIIEECTKSRLYCI